MAWRRRGLVVTATGLVALAGAGAGWALVSPQADTPKVAAEVKSARTAAVAYRGPEASPNRAPDPASVGGAVVNEPGGATVLRDETPGSAPSPEAPTTTDPPLVCRNSLNPACGPFYWQPAIENQPTVVRMDVPAAAPAAGERFSVRIHWSDGDADSASVNLRACREEHCIEVLPDVVCRGATPSGPWTPPPHRSGSGHFDADVTLPGIGQWTLVAEVSTYSASFVAWAEALPRCGRPDDPYAGSSSVSAVIEVDRVVS